MVWDHSPCFLYGVQNPSSSSPHAVSQHLHPEKAGDGLEPSKPRLTDVVCGSLKPWAMTLHLRCDLDSQVAVKNSGIESIARKKI